MREEIEILVVEDSPTQAAQLQYLLEGFGCRVRTVNNGQEALESIHAQKPTLVISDIQMPLMDGWELCRSVKSDENLKDIPIIILTSLAEPDDIIKGLKCGAESFFVKPPEEKVLLSQIEYILMNKKIRQSGGASFGIEIYFGGQKHSIYPERFQIIDLLISLYENFVEKYKKLRESNRMLEEANKIIEKQAYELEVLSFRNALSGLFNLNGFLTFAEQHLKIAKRHELSSAIIHVKLNNFDRIIEDFGYAESDKIVKDVADFLIKNFRYSDIIAHTGKDEFIVLTTAFSHEGTQQLVNRMESNLKSLNSQADRTIFISLGIGAAYHSHDAKLSIKDLMQQAREGIHDI